MKRFCLMCFLSVAIVSGAFLPAQAQEAILGVDEDFFTTSTTTTSTAIAVGVVVLTVTLINDSSAEIEVYLQNNAVALQQDLYLGGGETTRDLARLFHVPEEDGEAFFDLLFSHRQQLARLAERAAYDGASGAVFIEIVVENMLQDETLSAHAIRMWTS